MGNPTSKVDLSKTFALFLTEVVSDGTWADVLSTLKVDEPGEEAAATAIAVAAGQLWSNLSDDFVKEVWELVEGSQLQTAHTSGLASSVVVVATLSADGDFKNSEVAATGHGQADLEVVIQNHSFAARRSAGVVTFLFNAPTGLAETNLTGVTTALGISGDNIEMTVTGIAAKEIDWSVEIVRVRNLRPAP